MSEILSIFSKAGSLVASIFLLLWHGLKFIITKCWKGILLLGSLFLTLFGIHKATKEK